MNYELWEKSQIQFRLEQFTPPGYNPLQCRRISWSPAGLARCRWKGMSALSKQKASNVWADQELRDHASVLPLSLISRSLPILQNEAGGRKMEVFQTPAAEVLGSRMLSLIDPLRWYLLDFSSASDGKDASESTAANETINVSRDFYGF